MTAVVTLNAETSLATATKPPSALPALQIDVTDDAAAAALSPMDLAAWPLQDNANVSFHIAPAVTTADIVTKIHTALVLAGLQAQGEGKLDNGTRVVRAVKKATSASGASAPIRLNITDDDLIDEDNLLADSSNLLAPPPAMSATKANNDDDCAGREPCADCTCGRATENKGAAKDTIKKSSCGKCHLGDAFRCASCPYLGRPAFKPGEEHLVLDLQDDL